MERLQLSESEFFSIYSELRSELRLLVGDGSLDGERLVEAATERIGQSSDQRLQFDFSRGFIPLFKAMVKAIDAGRPFSLRLPEGVASGSR